MSKMPLGRVTDSSGVALFGKYGPLERKLSVDSTGALRISGLGSAPADPMENIEDTQLTVDSSGAIRVSGIGSLVSGALDIDNTGVKDVRSEIQAAIDAAANAGGGVVVLPSGTLRISASLVPKNKVTLRGASMESTILKPDANGFRAIDGGGASTASKLDYFALEELTVYGRHDVSPTLGLDSDRLVNIAFVRHVVMHRVKAIYSRQMSLTASYCDLVLVTNCYVYRTARDAINLSTCFRTIVSNNVVRNCADGAVEIHVNVALGNPANEMHVCSGNIIEDSFGIKYLGARRVAITGNTVTRAKGYGMFFSYDGLGEGACDSLALSIVGNVITDVINANKFGPSVVQCGIRVASDVKSFQAPVIGGAVPDINKPDVLGPLSNTSVAQNAGGWGINISDNIIIMCSHTAANYSDYGVGLAYLNTGYSDIASPNVPRLGEGIRIGGAVLDIAVRNNKVDGASSAIALESDTTYIGRLLCTGNQLTRYAAHGVSLETPSVLYGQFIIKDNYLDGDPYFEHANRAGAGDGTWSAAIQPSGVNYVNANGVAIHGNTFRNVNQCGHSNFGQSMADWTGNTYMLQPNSGLNFNGFGTGSRGIRETWGLGSISDVVVWEDSNPLSATYGRQLGRSAVHGLSSAMPTSGYWIAGSHIRTSSLIGAGAGQTIGWQRLTTGNAHVAGTDWRAINVTGA